MVDAFLTGHAPVKKHLNIMGLFDGDPGCRFCKMETETVYYIICCCKALVCQHYNFFAKFFVEPKYSFIKRPASLCKMHRVNEFGSENNTVLHNKPKAVVQLKLLLMGPSGRDDKRFIQA
jgi:hypothetical protein